jgi:translation initiation factor IF-3
VADDKDGHRINQKIISDPVRLVGFDGAALGIKTRMEALKAAQLSNLDLVEIAPQASPPVCKIMNYGKFRYEEQKKKAEARKKQKVVVVKEVKLRPAIDDNDYQVKMRNIKRFLGEGDKVKITLMFRRRELDHQQYGLQLIERVKTDIAEVAKIEFMPKLERNHMIMVVAPKQ